MLYTYASVSVYMYRYIYMCTVPAQLNAPEGDEVVRHGLRRIAVQRAGRAAGGGRALRKTVPFLSASLCLSRACLGKMIVSIYKWLKTTAFLLTGTVGPHPFAQHSALAPATHAARTKNKSMYIHYCIIYITLSLIYI